MKKIFIGFVFLVLALPVQAKIIKESLYTKIKYGSISKQIIGTAIGAVSGILLSKLSHYGNNGVPTATKALGGALIGSFIGNMYYSSIHEIEFASKICLILKMKLTDTKELKNIKDQKNRVEVIKEYFEDISTINDMVTEVEGYLAGQREARTRSTPSQNKHNYVSLKALKHTRKTVNLLEEIHNDLITLKSILANYIPEYLTELEQEVATLVTTIHKDKDDALMQASAYCIDLCQIRQLVDIRAQENNPITSDIQERINKLKEQLNPYFYQ